MALLDEQIEGKYEILEKIREGGMGAIYKVRHRLLDEVRIVKVIRAHGAPSPEAGERFLQEARAANRLRHPNVALLHDFAVGNDGNAFIVMELIDGWSLLEVLQGYGPPPLPLTLEIARQSLRALGYLHRQRIVHRDISPDNLMLTRDVEGQPLVKLIDLGIAKTLESGGGELTATGIFLGKPRYASPERLTGESCDARSDLYSFGVVLYELLTGRCPVRGQDITSLMAAHLFQPPLDFAESDPRGHVPADLREIVLKMLSKKPAERAGNAEELSLALARVQSRYPLSSRDFRSVVDVLLPLGANREPWAAANPTGSTQDRLDREFLMNGGETVPLVAPVAAPAVAPAAAPAAAQEAPPLEPTQPLTLRLPLSHETTRTPTAAAGPSVLDETWISHGPPRSLAETLVPAEAAPPSRPRRTAIFAAAALAAILGGGGLWWLLARGETEERPVPPPAVVVPAAVVEASPEQTVEPLPSGSPAPTPSATPLQAPPAETPAARTEAPARRARLAPPPEMEPGDWFRASDPGVEGPEPKQLPRYEYPAAARGTGRQATVRVAALVDETGKVVDTRVREGDGTALGFDEAAIEAVQRVPFWPATRDGVPGRMWTELILVFEEPAGPPADSAVPPTER